MTRIDHVGLNVDDLDTAVEWYAAAFDLTEEFRFSIDPVELRGVVLISDVGDRIELLNRPGAAMGMRPASPADAALTLGYSHFAIAVSDIEGTYDRLVAAGATTLMEPQPGPDRGRTVAFVADPDGNMIEILSRD